MDHSLNEIENTLLHWCNRRVGHYATVGVETDLLDEGLLDSLMVMDLVASIEKQYGFNIDHAEISPRHFRSVRTLAALVASHNSSLNE